MHILAILMAALAGALAGCEALGLTRSTDSNHKVGRTASEIFQMRNAIVNYHVRFGKYPADLSEVQTAMRMKFPELDPWGRPYEYALEEDSFILWSKGADPSIEDDDIWFDSDSGRIVTQDSRGPEQ